MHSDSIYTWKNTYLRLYLQNSFHLNYPTPPHPRQKNKNILMTYILFCEHIISFSINIQLYIHLICTLIVKKFIFIIYHFNIQSRINMICKLIVNEFTFIFFCTRSSRELLNREIILLSIKYPILNKSGKTGSCRNIHETLTLISFKNTQNP